MLSKNNNLPQSLLSIFALFLLIFISATTVTALNPIVEESSANLTSGKVAGISRQAVVKPLDIKLASTDSSAVISRDVSDEDIASISLKFDSLRSGIFNEELVSIYNPNNEIVKTKVSFYLPEDLKGKVKVYLEDEKDSLIMYTQDKSYGPKTITLSELSKRNFRVRVESLESLSTPVEFVFSFAHGY